jgi:precorrin-6B methylase 2
MQAETMQQAQDKLQSLTESLWIFSAFTVLAESGDIDVLNEKTTISNLKILEQAIHLLVETGLLISENETIRLATGMQELVKKMGLERISSQLNVTAGLTTEFIKSARDKDLIPGWHYKDELILQSQGKLSEHIVIECMSQDAKLQSLLKKPQTHLLDIGAGVGKISLRLCQMYDNVKVVALEPADAPFQLAKKNIEASHYAARVDLRKIYLEELADTNLYDVAWFPHMFFSNSILNVSISKIWNALQPGGMLATSAIFPDANNLSIRVKQLINSLYGGLRTGDELIKALSDGGFKDIQVFSEISGYRTITACKL